MPRENRQMAVKAVAPNTATCCSWSDRRTAPIRSAWWRSARTPACSSFLVDDRAARSSAGWLDGVENVAVTAGASAPEHLVQNSSIAWLRQHRIRTRWKRVELVEEDVRFSLPAELDRARIGADHHQRPHEHPTYKSRDSLAAAAAKAVGPSHWLSAGPAGSAGLLVRRTDRRHHPGVGLHSAAALAAPAGKTASGTRPRAR